jgi:hypothetical protein
MAVSKAQVNKVYIGVTIFGIKQTFMGRKTVYEPLKTELGIDKIEETPIEGYPSPAPVSDLIRDSLGIMLTVSYKKGTQTKTGKVFCPADKLGTAMNPTNGLVKKKYNGGDILRVYQSGDRRTSY